MSNCPRVDEAILFHLRELTQAEEQALQQHLNTCVSCRVIFAETADTLDLLALAAPPKAPPSDLKSKVMARVATEAVGTHARKAEAGRRWVPAVAAAAAVLALTVGTYGLIRIQTLQQQVAALQQSGPNLQRSVTLTGTPEAPGATGRLVVSREAGGTRIVLQTKGLPALDPGEVYQLWLMKGGTTVSGGLFVVDGTGNGAIAAWVPASIDFDTVGITCEPDAFGPQPRGTKMMLSL